MAKLQHYAISPDGATVLSFPQEKQARALLLEETSPVFGGQYASDKPETLAEAPLALLVTLHNRIRPEKPIKKFADRETALKRMVGVLEVLATPGPVPEGKVAGSISPPKEPKAPRAPRQGKMAGMVIRLIEKANPRKPGTSGHRSRELITDGMTVEAYLAAGGIKRDLEWDIDKGYTAVEAPVAKASNE